MPYVTIDLAWHTDRLCDVVRWQLANPHKRDEGPEVPPGGARIWSIFLALHAARTAGMGANPITYGEMEAYARLQQTPLRPFEVDMLRAVDRAYMDASRNSKDMPPPEREVQSRKMSPGLFDALFGGRS